jgi:polysaccharide export outer membrane protein
MTKEQEARQAGRHLTLAVSVLLLTITVLWSTDGTTAEQDYRLSTGDRLRVTVFGHEDLSGEVEVNGSGEISLPLIDEVDAAGRSLYELEVAIVDALKPDYLKNPRVSIEMLDYRPFYIIGEVTAPGSYPYVNGMTVVNAVAVAGGFTYRARKGRIRIKREGENETIELTAEMDTPVQPGDVIEVPERFF